MVYCMDGDVAKHKSIDDTCGAVWWSCRTRCKEILAVVVGLDDIVARHDCWCRGAWSFPVVWT